MVVLVCGACHFDRALNDEFNVKFSMFFFQPTLKSDLKEVQFTQNYLFWLRHPYNTLKVPQISKLAVVKKHKNNKYSKFYAKFVI